MCMVWTWVLVLRGKCGSGYLSCRGVRFSLGRKIFKIQVEIVEFEEIFGTVWSHLSHLSLKNLGCLEILGHLGAMHAIVKTVALMLLVAEARSLATNHGWLRTDSQVCTARLRECWWLQDDIRCLPECQTLSCIKCLFLLPRGVVASYSWQDRSVKLSLQSFFVTLLNLAACHCSVVKFEVCKNVNSIESPLS